MCITLFVLVCANGRPDAFLGKWRAGGVWHSGPESKPSNMIGRRVKAGEGFDVEIRADHRFVLRAPVGDGAEKRHLIEGPWRPDPSLDRTETYALMTAETFDGRPISAVAAGPGSVGILADCYANRPFYAGMDKGTFVCQVPVGRRWLEEERRRRGGSLFNRKRGRTLPQRPEPVGRSGSGR